MHGAKRRTLQNAFILVASYVFYGWWSWKFLLLILASTLVDYVVGRSIPNYHGRTRKALLWLSMGVNLGALALFKYHGFFVENLQMVLNGLGLDLTLRTLSLVLPVGISFYTFQTMSYTIDVYRGKMEPTKDFVAFAAYVSFFPQLVAGPIERAERLLPQFLQTRSFNMDRAKDGLRQVLWGMFKKVVIADNCAPIVDQIFASPNEMGTVTLILGAVLFAFQIYGDFSGYSDIALGLAKMFGFDLMVNFRTPYFSRDIAEFWRRWHISLSTWFRDYLYIPLGGSKGERFQQIRNVFIVFLISGFWHGANWTFIVWGGLNALFFLPLLISNNNRRHLNIDVYAPSWRVLLNIGFTFALTCFAWIFFRAESVSDAWSYIVAITNWNATGSEPSLPIYFSIILMCFVIMEWYTQDQVHALQRLKLRPMFRWTIYFIVFYLCAIYFDTNQSEFIYFQF